MADVNRGARPLSPHATIYRWPSNAIMSIAHRITGVALAGAALLVIWWFTAAAVSPAYFNWVNGILTCWSGDVILFGAMAALWYHLVNGVRHLIWDTGAGFSDTAVTRSAITGLILAVVLSIVTVVMM